MTTLVLHPDDRSTDDLRSLYEGIPDRTVITGGRTKDEVRSLVAAHDRVILCGRGDTTGLLSINRFPAANGLDIDASRAARRCRPTRARSAAPWRPGTTHACTWAPEGLRAGARRRPR